MIPQLDRLDPDDPDLERFIGVIGDIGDDFVQAPDDARFLLRAIIDDQAFLYAYKDGVDPEDEANPLVRLFTVVWGWLAAAREAGVIRPVRVLQAARNLIGILVFEPAYGSDDVDDPKRLASRRRELTRFVRGALAPLQSEEQSDGESNDA